MYTNTFHCWSISFVAACFSLANHAQNLMYDAAVGPGTMYCDSSWIILLAFEFSFFLWNEMSMEPIRFISDRL
jgi:hypothetical protein